MKIAGIYSDRAFIKSDNAVLSGGESFYCPEGCENGGVELRWGIAAKINHVCKSVPAKHAGRFYEDICFAFDFALKDKSNGAFAYAFDYSFALGEWKKKDDETLIGASISLNKGDENLDCLDEALFELDGVIERISKTISLKVGDVIFLPLDKDAKSVEMEKVFEVFAGDECLISCEIK